MFFLICMNIIPVAEPWMYWCAYFRILLCQRTSLAHIMPEVVGFPLVTVYSISQKTFPLSCSSVPENGNYRLFPLPFSASEPFGNRFVYAP